MPTPFAVHRLTPDDIGVMRDLNALFARAFDDEARYAAAPPDDAYLRDLLGREQVLALVARDAAGAVLGGLVAYELPKFERAHSEIYLYDLAVEATHRRRGIATALIGRLCDLAATRNAWVVFVQADYGDDPAIALYEKLGVREEVLHFDIAPGPAPRPPGAGRTRPTP